MSGRKSRTKGSTGELEVVKLLSDVFPNASRELEQYQGQLGRDLRETSPLCIQIKRHKIVTGGEIKKAFAEADSAVDSEYTYPVVFYREDRKHWRVATNLATMVDMMGVMQDDSDERLMINMTASEFLEWYKVELHE